MDCSCDPLALTTAINTLAVAIAENLTDDELALVSAIFTQMGDTLITIAAQREMCANLLKKSREPSGKSIFPDSPDTSRMHASSDGDTPKPRTV